MSLLRQPPRRPSHGRQYGPRAGATQPPAGPVSEGPRPVRPPSCPHHPAAFGGARLDVDLRGAVLLQRHRRPVEAALRGRRGRRPCGGGARAAAGAGGVGGAAGHLGQDADSPRLRVLPQPLVLRHAGPGAARHAPRAGQRRHGPADAAAAGDGVAQAPSGPGPRGPGAGAQAAEGPRIAAGFAGRRGGGVPGRGGPEPQPRDRLHVDAGGRTGRGGDARDQRQTLPGRVDELADRGAGRDARPAPSATPPCSSPTWTTCGGASGVTR